MLLKAPLHILAMDYLSLSLPTDLYQNILVMTDLFTKYAWAVPTLDQTATTTARVLWSTVFPSFGCPEILHSDQGPAVEAKVIRELCQLYRCQKTHTTPYLPHWTVQTVQPDATKSAWYPGGGTTDPMGRISPFVT